MHEKINCSMLATVCHHVTIIQLTQSLSMRPRRGHHPRRFIELLVERRFGDFLFHADVPVRHLSILIYGGCYKVFFDNNCSHQASINFFCIVLYCGGSLSSNHSKIPLSRSHCPRPKIQQNVLFLSIFNVTKRWNSHRFAPRSAPKPASVTT